MAATPFDGAITPELALVDPDLAAQLRGTLEGASAPSRMDVLRRVQSAWPVGSEDALQRLVDLCDVEPPRRRRRFGAAKFGLAVATWGTFALLLVETQINGL